MHSNNFLQRFFWNYIYSGKEWDPVQSRQVSFINSFSLIGIFSAFVFGVYRIGVGDVGGWVEIALGFIAVLNVWYLRKSFNTDRASGVLLSIMFVMLAFLFVDGGIADTGLYWVFTFPVLAFFLFDDVVGLRWNAGLLVLLSLISLAKFFGMVATPYDWVVLRQTLFSFLAVVGLLYFYTKFTAVNARIFAERTKKLEATFKVEKEKIETTAHQIETALKDKLGTFFQTAGDLMCTANDEGYFVEINPAFTKSLGYSSEEILKTPFIDLVHEDDKEKTSQAMKGLFRGEFVENFVNRYRRKDGTYAWFMWNATEHDGVVYAIAHPVDGLMEAQGKLQAKLIELEKLNRLMVDRELTMVQMKKELTELKGEK